MAIRGPRGGGGQSDNGANSGLDVMRVKATSRQKNLVCGVGVNDAEEKTTLPDGKQCRIYTTWTCMLKRCYNKERPAYHDCTVCQDWLYFSNFRAWMIQQDYQGKQLDKDILVVGNKIYSPETCRFVSSRVNLFVADSDRSRGKYLIGCCFKKSAKKFRAMCRDGSGNSIHLGYFDTEIEAHRAWRKCKHEIACKLADEQDDPDIAHALRRRFL